MGNSGQGPVLPGQVQGVKSGAGVSIANDGSVSFDSTSAQGVVKTNNANAFNSYVWPNTAESDAFLFNSSNAINWVKVGLGLKIEGTSPKILKQYVKVSTSAPSPGDAANQATEGSLYWNSNSDSLFIYVNSNWQQVSYGPLNLNSELLVGTYTLFVNPEIGSDIYVTGVYDPEATPVITSQMTNAGYTPQRPFKTIARAALEVARIQTLLGNDSLLFDRFIIKCSTGEHIIDNALGSNLVELWADESVPSSEQLRAMNSSGYGGIILPKGVSVIGEDLRKTVIRPTFVPPKTGDLETDRASIFRVTGGSFFFNFTFKDKIGLNQSHHLLDCFSFVSDDDLEDYYAKVKTIFAQDAENQIVYPGETEIVAPVNPGAADPDTDGVFGSSPYIFNCSIRSDYGICGINADGNDVTGFKSMVVAQFTGVSLQKDLSCWQKYNTGTKTWGNTVTTYSSYISLDPNNLRMDPSKRSFHTRAINGAFIQTVSVFAIGQGINHWVKSGGEISITNSNSSFGGCAALAQGHKPEPFPQDTNWVVGSINLATNLTDQNRSITTIYLGIVDNSVGNTDTTIKLVDPLVESSVYLGVPELVASKGYTLRENSYLWIENPNGLDWRSPLSSSAWNSSQPDEIEVVDPMENQSGGIPGVGANPDLAGSKVYIRRLADTRTADQRRYSLDVTNTDIFARTPLRDYVLQTTVGGGGGVIGTLPEEDMVIVNKSGPLPVGSLPISKKAQIVIQRSNADNIWAANKFYRPGDTVKKDEKHFSCLIRNSDAIFDLNKWSESYVHMENDYNAYDYLNSVSPAIFFDNDTDGNSPTTTCGYNLTTCWGTDISIKNQYTSATDYLGVYQFLIGIGFSPTQATDILYPTVGTSRKLNPSSSLDMKGYIPDGAANILSNWPIEFRRPSIIRMFSHSWEWTGFLNYTKALPQYQGDLSVQNQFTSYFTNQKGGRVYASGFNQEGFFVSAAGLTDLATGSSTSVAELGNPLAGIDIPTYYPYLSVDDLEVNNSLSVNGNVDADNVYSPGAGLVLRNKIFDKSFYTPSGTLTDLTFSSNTTLTEPVYYCKDLTVNSGVTVKTKFLTTIFYCTGVVTINGTISADGIGPLGGHAHLASISSAEYAGSYSSSPATPGMGLANSLAFFQPGSLPTANYNYTSGGLNTPLLSLTGAGGGVGVASVKRTGSTDSYTWAAPGGSGGGGIVIRALGGVSIGASGSISANGNPGWTKAALGDLFSGPTLGVGIWLTAGSGGGSGGTIIIHSDGLIVNQGTISVKGGNGSSAERSSALDYPDLALGGGGGGGGWVILQQPTGSPVSGTVDLTGGAFGLTIGTGTFVAFGGPSGGNNAGSGGYHKYDNSVPTSYISVPSELGKLSTFGSPFD